MSKRIQSVKHELMSTRMVHGDNRPQLRNSIGMTSHLVVPCSH